MKFLKRMAAFCAAAMLTGSAALAQGLPFDLTGIDFSMTALFVVICVEKALKAKNRISMLIGGGCSLAMLFLLGQSAFLAPALTLTALLLTVIDIRKGADAA